MKRIVTLWIAAVVLAAGSPSLAAVRVKTITPEMLKVSHPALQPDYQFGYAVRAATTCELNAKVTVPAGSRLRKLEVAGLVQGAAPSGSVSVWTYSPLERCASDACTALELDLSAFTPGVIDWQTRTATSVAPGLARITRGETVEVIVYLGNADLAVGPIKLYYSTP